MIKAGRYCDRLIEELDDDPNTLGTFNCPMEATYTYTVVNGMLSRKVFTCTEHTPEAKRTPENRI